MTRREPPGSGPCPWCGGPAATAFWTMDRNRAVDDSRFKYRRCETCRTVFLRDVPEDLGRWYPDDYYAFPSLAELDEIGRAETYKIEAVLPHVRGGRLVEIGPGFGVFARRAALAGFEVCGLEMDAACCEHLRDVVGVEAVQTPAHEALRALPPSDVIALWHALEHVPDPGALLGAAARNLRPGGIFVAALPTRRPGSFGCSGRAGRTSTPRATCICIPAATLMERGRAQGLERVALTSDDGGARHWNAFGWGRGLVPPAPGYVLTQLSVPLGRAVAALAAGRAAARARERLHARCCASDPRPSRSSAPRRAGAGLGVVTRAVVRDQQVRLRRGCGSTSASRQRSGGYASPSRPTTRACRPRVEHLPREAARAVLDLPGRRLRARVAPVEGAGEIALEHERVRSDVRIGERRAPAPQQAAEKARWGGLVGSGGSDQADVRALRWASGFASQPASSSSLVEFRNCEPRARRPMRRRCGRRPTGPGGARAAPAPQARCRRSAGARR